MLEAGSAAAVLVYENSWAAPLATALIRGGARLVAGARIPAPVLLEALDALEPPSTSATPPVRGRDHSTTRGRRTMPGLIRGVARTAVIAGTATAVSNRVSRRQAGRWAAKEQQQYEHEPEQQQQQPPPPQYAPPPPPPAPASTGMDDKLAQLQQLGELKAQGVLNDLEFEQQKARILAS